MGCTVCGWVAGGTMPTSSSQCGALVAARTEVRRLLVAPPYPASSIALARAGAGCRSTHCGVAAHGCCLVGIAVSCSSRLCSAVAQVVSLPLCAPRTLSCVALFLCCAVLCCAVLCCAVLCCAVLCCAVLCCAVLCCAVLCCGVLCCIVLHCGVLSPVWGCVPVCMRAWSCPARRRAGGSLLRVV
jgi:hypothetical protein